MENFALEGFEEAFAEVLSTAPHERAALLESRLEDRSQRAELGSLVEAAEAAEPYFESLAAVIPALLQAVAEGDEASPVDVQPAAPSLDHYRIEEELGRGGMGVVYRATDMRLGRQVALKLLRPHALEDREAQERFRVEARAVAALDHPNVCALHDVGEDADGRTYLVMGYYEGSPLNRLLEQGPLPVDEAVSCARQIAGALAAAHEGGIVHRDVKPGNVLVTPQGVVKVLDFGVAKIADVTITGAGERLGTVAYMSPEQTRGEEVDRASDLWSLGAVLYEMLTAQRPFRGNNDRLLVQAIRHDSPIAPSKLRADVPSDVDRAVLALLSKTPAAREEGFAWLLGQTARAARPPTGRSDRRAGGRLTAAVAVGMLGLGAVALLGNRGTGLSDGPADARVPGALVEPTDLILASFSSGPEDTALARTMTNALWMGLTQSRHLRFADPGRVGEILTLMRKPGGPLDRATALDVAVRGGMPAVVSPEIRRVGNGFVLTAQVVTPNPERTVAEAMSTAAGEDEIMDALDRLARDLREALGESMDLLRQSPPLPDVTTGSVEALRLYLEGFSTPDERAIGLLEEAVSLDPEFALAWRRLAVELSNRRQQRSRQVEAFRNAYDHRDHLADAERAVVEVSYFSLVTAEPERVIDVAETHLARHPDDRNWTNVAVREYMAGAYRALRQPDRAEEVLRSLLIDYAPDWSCGTPVANLAASLADQGRFDEALTTLTDELEWCREMGRDATPWIARDLAFIAAAHGEYSLAEEQLRAALAEGADDPSWRAIVGVALAELSAVQGQIGEARAHAEDAAAAHRSRGMAGDGLRVSADATARELYLTGTTGQQVATVDVEMESTQLAALDPLDRPYGPLVIAHARAGRTAEARRLLAERDALAASAPELWGLDRLESTLARAELALAEGRHADAVRAFRSADFGGCTVCALPGLARAYDAAGMPDSAIAVLERYLRTPSSERMLSGSIRFPGADHTFLGPALERLAQLYDGLGDSANATVRYTEFAELWSDADPSLQPRVRAALGRVAELERPTVP